MKKERNEERKKERKKEGRKKERKKERRGKKEKTDNEMAIRETVISISLHSSYDNT